MSEKIGSIFIIEDDEVTFKKMEQIFKENNFDVSGSLLGEEGLLKIKELKPDLVILDMMLPDINGWEIGKALKQNSLTSHIPIIVVSSRNEIDEMAERLEIFADNYITKPFNEKLLLAHVNALMRRVKKNKAANKKTVFNNLEIDFYGFQVKAGGKIVNFTKKEFDIFALLAKNPGHAFSREQIIQAIFDEDERCTERAIDVHILRMRKKLGKAAKYIETVPCVGYKLKDE